MFHEEKWCDVVGLEGWYQVSDLGRVKRIAPIPRHRMGRILNGQTNRQGYAIVTLTMSGESPHRTVHSLVMAAFVGPRPAGHEINHINGVKDDNRLSNLEYVTPKENISHARDVLGFKYGYHPRPKKEIAPREVIRHGERKLSHAAAREIKKLYHERKHSQVELGEMFGVSHTMIGRIVRGKAWVSPPLEQVSEALDELVKIASAAGIKVDIENVDKGLSMTIHGLFAEGENYVRIQDE